jgi:membrane protease YdiL (CAAX protease family)
MNQNRDQGNASSFPSITKISLFSGIIWLILSIIIIHFIQKRLFFDVLAEGSPYFIQLASGIFFGILFGVAAISLVNNPQLKKVLDDYVIIRQLKEFSLTPFQIIHISVVAGITEEILFRAAIQPLIGIWLTSLLFIAIHGYIRFKTVPHMMFGLFTFLLSMMLGYLYMFFGIIAAIAAHAVYDVIVLWKISNESPNNRNDIT